MKPENKQGFKENLIAVILTILIVLAFVFVLRIFGLI